MLTRKTGSIQVMAVPMPFPYSGNHPAGIQLHLSNPAGSRTTPTTIFVIDHDAAVRDALTVTLHSTGFSVITFASAQEFLDSLPVTEKGCLLIEFDLEDMTGADLITRLADKRVDLPTIIMSARLRLPVLADPYPSRIAAILQKPFGQSELLQCLQDILKGP